MRTFLSPLAIPLLLVLAPPSVHAQDAARGRQVFAACSVCHATTNANGVGPGLAGIVGRKAGTEPGYRYSRAMRASGIVWNEGNLNGFILDPGDVVPGNVMPYSGMTDPTSRADLIAYLKTLR